MATCPFTDDFEGQMLHNQIPATNPTPYAVQCGTLFSGFPGGDTGGYWEANDQVPNPTAGCPPPGTRVARGVTGYTGGSSPQSFTLGYFAYTLSPAADGLKVEYYLYLPSEWDPSADGSGLAYIKIVTFGDATPEDMGSNNPQHNSFDLEWFFNWTTGITSVMLRYNGGNPTAYPVSNYLTTPQATNVVFNQWMKLTVYIKYDTSEQNGDGVCMFWMDTGDGDVLMGSRSDLTLWRNVGGGCDGVIHWIRVNYHMNPYSYAYPHPASFFLADISMTAEGTAIPPLATHSIPHSGPLSGYTTATIKGTNLSQVNEITFDSVPATQLNIIDAETVECRVPAGRADGVTVDIVVKSAGGITTLQDAYTYLDVPSYNVDDPFTGGVLGGNWSAIVNNHGDLEHYDATSWCLIDDTDPEKYDPDAGDDAVALYSGAVANDCKLVLYGLCEEHGALDWAEILAIVRASGANWAAFDATAFEWNVVYGAFSKFDNGARAGISSYTDAPDLPSQFRMELEVDGTQFHIALIDNSAADGFLFEAEKTITTGAATGSCGFCFRGGTNFKDDSYVTRADRVLIVDANTVATPPTVTDITPNEGDPAGGTAVTITGTDFSVGCNVHFGVPGDWVVAQNINRVNATTITCDAPAGDVGDNVYVRVTNADTLWDYSDGEETFYYTFVGTIALNSVTPNEGQEAGGDTVVLAGTGFVEGCEVFFGDQEATNVVFVDATEVHCDTPPSAAGAVNVQIVNPDSGNDTLVGGYTYGTKPTITKCAPSSGPRDETITVTLTGTGFTGVTTVTFGGIPGTNLSVVSDTEISVKTPVFPTKGYPEGTKVDIYAEDAYGSDTLVDGWTCFDPDAKEPPPDQGPVNLPTALTITGPLNIPANIALTLRGVLKATPGSPYASEMLSTGGTKPGTKVRVENRYGRTGGRTRKRRK